MSLSSQGERKFSVCFEIQDLDQIHTRPHLDSGDFFLFVKTVREGNVDPEESFVLKFDNLDEATQIEKKIKDYVKEAQPRVYFGTEHQDHEYEKYRANGMIEENMGIRCAACDLFLKGLLFTGVRCKTCDKIYHEDCFFNEKSEVDSTNEDDDV